MIFTCEDLIAKGIIPEGICICDKNGVFNYHEIYRSDMSFTSSATLAICTPVRQYLCGDKYKIPKEVWEKLMEVR